jgi:hypothetical protein
MFSNLKKKPVSWNTHLMFRKLSTRLNFLHKKTIQVELLCTNNISSNLFSERLGSLFIVLSAITDLFCVIINIFMWSHLLRDLWFSLVNYSKLKINCKTFFGKTNPNHKYRNLCFVEIMNITQIPIIWISNSHKGNSKPERTG